MTVTPNVSYYPDDNEENSMKPISFETPIPASVINSYSRISYEAWTKAKTQWERTKLRVNVFIEDYSVELQTAVVVVAGVILADRIVRSNQSVKQELHRIKTDLELRTMEADLNRQDAWFEKEDLKDVIRRAKTDGREFTYYPGLGVLFNKIEDNF